MCTSSWMFWALELRGDRGLQQLNLALAQFGFVDVDNRALTTRNALCLGSAKPRSQAERLYHLSEVFGKHRSDDPMEMVHGWSHRGRFDVAGCGDTQWRA